QLTAGQRHRDKWHRTYGQEDTVRPGGDGTWMAPVTRCLKRVTGHSFPTDSACYSRII
ncbi:hypothetical protein B0T17DRAFT_527229, partial [Bombardia bombarda]